MTTTQTAEEKKSKQFAYELGQVHGYANKVTSNPYDARSQDAEWCAYMDGYEDARALYANEATLDPRDFAGYSRAK